MSTIRILLGIICLVAIGQLAEPSSRVLEVSKINEQGLSLPAGQAGSKDHDVDSMMLREKILGIARSQIGVREATGNNDGVAVEAYLKVTKLPKGNPWCAAFVSWVFKEAGFTAPRTAWSPALFPFARRTGGPLPADILGIYYMKLKRIAHCGIVERRYHDWIISIEGNTSAGGGVPDGESRKGNASIDARLPDGESRKSNASIDGRLPDGESRKGNASVDARLPDGESRKGNASIDGRLLDGESRKGNASIDGREVDREGQGVYRKWRHIKTISKFANWVKK